MGDSGPTSSVWFQKKPSVLFQRTAKEGTEKEEYTTSGVDVKRNVSDVVSDDNQEWQDVCRSKKKSSDPPEASSNKMEKETLTEEQMEALRELRRKRRQKEKIAKRQRKEQEKLQQMINSSKSTKIQLVNPHVLSDFNQRKVLLRSSERVTSCFEDEYPSLNQNTVKTVASKKVSHPDSGGSEWETEEEDATTRDFQKVPNKSDSKLQKVKSVSDSPTKTFASVLASESTLASVPAKSNVESSLVVKKVKRKDPITLDFAKVIKVAPTKKSSAIIFATKSQHSTQRKPKPEYESTSSKIRGKRRLVPKKKRPTKLKSIILKDRQSRKELKKTELNEQELKNLDPDNSLVTEKLEFQPQVLKTSDPEPINSPVSEKLEVQPQECDQTTELLSDNSQVVPRKVKKKKRKQSKPHSNDNEMQNEKSDPRDQIVHTCDKESATADSIQLNVKETASQMPEFLELTPFEKVKKMIHSRKFRPYCDHVLSPKLDEMASKLLDDLVRFQDRQFLKNQIKAKAKRRYVAGFREIKKFLIVKKIDALLLAPDIENVASDGGLNDTIDCLVDLCVSNRVHYFFVMNRRNLGRACKRKVGVSAVGIMNYQGSESNFIAMKDLLPSLQHEYKLKFDVGLRSIGSLDEYRHKLPAVEVPESCEIKVENTSNDLDDVSKKIVNLLR